MSHADSVAIEQMGQSCDAMEFRLLNWANWALYGRGGKGHCGSIEHRWRSPQCWYPQEPVIPVDVLDALNVEHCMVRLPAFERRLLKEHYVWRRSARNICRGLAIHKDRFAELLRRARLMVRNLLRAI